MSQARKARATRSHVVSIRLKKQQMDGLRKLALRFGRTPSETSAILLEECLRRNSYGGIDFRDSVAGRLAYAEGSSLAVWEVAMIARGYKNDEDKTAKHLGWTVYKVRAALNYAYDFADEINALIDDNNSHSFSDLSRRLPNAELFVLRSSTNELDKVSRSLQERKKPSSKK